MPISSKFVLVDVNKSQKHETQHLVCAPPLKVLCTSKVSSLTTFQRKAEFFIFDVECRRSLEVYTTVVRYRGQFIKAEVCSCERRGLSFFWNPCLRWKYNLFMHVHKQEECQRRFCMNKSCAIHAVLKGAWGSMAWKSVSPNTESIK